MWIQWEDDIEPIEALEDVDIVNYEDEEPLEAEIPRVRMNPKLPTKGDLSWPRVVWKWLCEQ